MGDLSANQWQIYRKVKEIFPQASRVALKDLIHLGLEVLVWLCLEGGVPMDDVSERIDSDSKQLRRGTVLCGVCMEECREASAISCVQIGNGNGAHAAHSFCAECIRRQARVAVELNAIDRTGLGLNCMQHKCTAVLLQAHIAPVIDSNIRERLESHFADLAIQAAGVEVERCQRCPFAMVIENDFPVFICRRCGFEYRRSRNQQSTNGHNQGSRSEIMRQLENELSTRAVAKLQRCKGCDSPFEKTEGCDNITCRCGSKQRYEGIIFRDLDNNERASIIQRYIDNAVDSTVVAELHKMLSSLSIS